MLEKFTVTSYKTARSRISTFKCCSIEVLCAVEDIIIKNVG